MTRRKLLTVSILPSGETILGGNRPLELNLAAEVQRATGSVSKMDGGAVPIQHDPPTSALQETQGCVCFVKGAGPSGIVQTL